MPATEPQRDLEEIGRRGEEIFDRTVRPPPGPADDNKFYVGDINSGDYELDMNDIQAIIRLRNRPPEGELYLGRVGHPAADRMGWRGTMSLLRVHT